MIKDQNIRIRPQSAGGGRGAASGWAARGTLTGRAVLVTCLVALTAVLITAAVGLPLVVRSANDSARLVLADKARVAANAIEGRAVGGELRAELRARRVAQTLREQGVQAVLIRDGAAMS